MSTSLIYSPVTRPSELLHVQVDGMHAWCLQHHIQPRIVLFPTSRYDGNLIHKLHTHILFSAAQSVAAVDHARIFAGAHALFVYSCCLLLLMCCNYMLR